MIIATDVPGVIATIRTIWPGGYVVLELSGPIDRFSEVDAHEIAARYGFAIDGVADECSYVLGDL